MLKNVDEFGNLLVSIFHKLGLFAIGAATAWAAGWTFYELWTGTRYATILDILLLFIYLEIGAMVGIYFKTNHMPVRFLLYIAITALTRHMVDTMSHVPINITEMLGIAGATFIIAISILVVRYTSAKFPSDRKEDVI